MTAIPHASEFDSTLGLLRDPYRYASRQGELPHSEILRLRLVLRDTLVLRGATAGAVFFDPERFDRQGMQPGPLRATLIGQHGVQTLDGPEHLRRKATFLDLTSAAAAAALADQFQRDWLHVAQEWQAKGSVVLYDELQSVITRSVCAWAGLPLSDEELPLRTSDLTALFNSAGASVGGHLRARLARKRVDHWMAKLVDRVRSRELTPPESSVLRTFSEYRTTAGELLPLEVAAVEVVNILRPTVAIALYITFCAHALHLNPGARNGVGLGDTASDERFIQEVRRFYPFIPFLAGRVRMDFTWNGCALRQGRRVLFDVYGTNHDERTWTQAFTFDPERYRATTVTPVNLVPQGGGEAATGHRCPGEGFVFALSAVALRMFQTRLRYEVPEQDLGIDFTRLPALPRSRMQLARIKLGD